ncbi:hypothetical protein EDB87DRAFT_1556495, partial [Lactarius vividus]
SRYTSALQALSHVFLLAPQNLLQAAETAYAAEDILAIRFFLITIDMVGDDEESPPADRHHRPRLVWSRTGQFSVHVKALRNQLTNPSSQVGRATRGRSEVSHVIAADTRPPEHLSRLRQLAREVIETTQAS